MEAGPPHLAMKAVVLYGGNVVRSPWEMVATPSSSEG